VYRVFAPAALRVEQDIVKTDEESRERSVFRKPPRSTAEEQPRISGDVFERKKKILHPFLSVTFLFSDNIMNRDTSKESDFITTISPGIWLSVPAFKNMLPLMDTSSRTPAGFIVEQLRHQFLWRFRAFLLYQADIELFARSSNQNTIRHRLEGSLEYAFTGGLSIQLRDQLLISHDERGTGASVLLDEFYSNLFDVILRYDTGRRLSLRGRYSNFFVHYGSSRNSFRRRVDNALSGAVFYKIWPKTSIMAEYRFVDIEYDKDDLSDSEEHHFLGGLRWNITAKTEGILKAGYGLKRFDSGINTSRSFIIEANIRHRLTSKVMLSLRAWRKTNETDILLTNYIFTNGINLGYQHRFTSRISGSANLSYVRDSYSGDFTFGGVTKQRKDTYYQLGLAVHYEFRRWLRTDLGYTLSKRDSNFSDFDYLTNSVYLRLAGAL
jgi:hypothetical protein